MFKASEIVSKPLISLFEAKICGTISNIIFDSKFRNAKLFVVDCDNGDDIATKYLELSEVVNLGFDAVIIKNYEYLLSEWTAPIKGILSPINCACYNQDGKLIGTVKDITIEGSAVTNILIGDTDYLPSQLLSISDKLILINDTNLPIKLPLARKFPSKALFRTAKDKIVHVTEKIEGAQEAPPSPLEVPPQEVPPINVNSQDVPPINSNSQILPQNISSPTKLPTPSPPQEAPQINSSADSHSSTLSISTVPRTPVSPSAAAPTLTDSAPTLTDSAVAPPQKPKQAAITSSTLQQAKLLLEKLKYSQFEPLPTPAASSESTDSDIEMPTKINQNSTIVSRTPSPNSNSTKSYQFLCGKTTTADITDLSGATIIARGLAIDNDIIGIAKLNDKLVHLALHSK